MEEEEPEQCEGSEAGGGLAREWGELRKILESLGLGSNPCTGHVQVGGGKKESPRIEQ